MALALFLDDLFTTGDARPERDRWDGADRAEALSVLQNAAGRDTPHLPGEAPAFSPEHALWAGAWFHEACRLLLRRDLGAEEVKQLAEWKEPASPWTADDPVGNRPERPHAAADGKGGKTGPTGSSAVQDRASAAWSADLALRHLPEFLKRAVSLAPDDPLVKTARTLAAAWPLSGAGIPGVAPDPAALEALLGHPTLRRVLADRLIAAGEAGWLAVPGCRAAVSEALGAMGDELAPDLFEAGAAPPAFPSIDPAFATAAPRT